MKNYELVFSNGTTLDFKANGLREAKKIAAELKGDYDSWAWIYEGFTAKAKI